MKPKINYKFLFFIFLILTSLNFISANTYINDIYFTVPSSVYMTNERIELKGYVYQINYTDNGTVVSNYSVLANATVNLTIRNTNGTYASNYTFTTDSGGAFYSRSNFYSTATEVTAPSIPGNYNIRAEYIDVNGNRSFSQIEVSVVNQTLDILSISPEKAIYNPSETVKVNIEAIKLIGDKILYVSNISVNGSLRNSTKTSLQTFNCTTGTNGKCSVSITAPSTYGDYILELNNFKAFSSFSVVPFSYVIYMKDDLGKSLKNIFARGEQARVEVKINNASANDEYTFSGYIADSNGNTKDAISSTALNFNNSFTNSFLFSVDTDYDYGAYSVHVTVTKTGDGSISSLASFQVQDWMLSINKKEVDSGFEYEYSAFSNKTLRFEALPTYRSNGSVIAEINSSFFNVTLKDSLNNIFSTSNATWNASCGKSGCYEFLLTSPANTGQYILSVTLSYSGDAQAESRVINVINSVMSAESTDKDGSIKELFGTNEYAYLSLSAYNLSTSLFNLTDAEIFLVSYMNGSDISYTQVNNFELVNLSNSAYEWAWNSTLQRIKLDVPKYGGVYNIFVFGNNRTLGANAKFIVNPYDFCSAAKDTAGQITSGGSYYYVWQFKTTDTVYFEIKITQANNPLGRATALNSSGNGSSSASYTGCIIDTQTKQVVSNATITVSEIRNLESGALQTLNSSESVCQASDNSGGYTCTVKPLSKWDGGVSIVKFNIQGQDGTTSIAYSRFEARAFYLYGWSQTWQNSPSTNLTLNVQMYEAGAGWWGGGGSGGLSGSVTVKRIEYQGRDGEWLWPPVDSGYNVSLLNSSSISGSTGTINIPVSNMPGSSWKTGYYRVILQGTTSAGDSDYGYAWFGVKLWDVYGSPIECTSTACNYKSYFNSKENITLYVKISKAGSYNYWYSGGENIWGNVSIGIKKIQNCRTWPCKELNSSQYSASTINVNQSSPWYWSSNATSAANYIIQINSTTGTWGTGWYNVILNVNDTDTGYAWFNTIAFYVETQPMNSNGTIYKYSIRGNQAMYFNITTTKSYKWWSGSVRYNQSDYVNTTFDDAVLRTWDQTTWQSREYNYPENINVTPNNISGTGIINVTFKNGTWPTGYYWGEINFKNLDNETSSGWLWFNVQPFRVQLTTSGNSYNMDNDQCVNASLNIYDSDWYSNSPFYGNYSIMSVYEDIWSYGARSRTDYTNYTTTPFNATANVTFCPNNGSWSGGSWGGYHYLNVVVRDNTYNDSQSGWLWFRAVPFTVSWSGTGGSKLINQNVEVSATLTKPSGGNGTGNLTRLYQWRYDNYRSTREEYVFKIGNCYSNVSGQCTVNGSANITIYAPSGGWRVGYNYIYSEWTKNNDAGVTIQDWGGIYFDGREAYNGYFSNYDNNWNWKYYFNVNENITIKLTVRNSSYNNVNVNITSVQYAYSGDNCWSDWCRTYTSATFSPTNTSNGETILKIQVPSSNWTRGYYDIKASVSGSYGTATITGGSVRVKDFAAPNITIITPVNNGTYNTTLIFNATTNENAQCYLYLINYNNFNNWYCSGWNSTNSTTNSSMTQQSIGACNTTLYNYTGNSYYTEWVSNGWRSTWDGNTYTWGYGTYLSTGGTRHTYTFNITNWTNQHYGIVVTCNDDDWNYITERVTFKANTNVTSNASSNQTSFSVSINSPTAPSPRIYSGLYYINTSNIIFNFTIGINGTGTCRYTLNSGVTNYTMSTIDNRTFNATNSSIGDGNYLVYAYCNDSSGNVNNTMTRNFTVDKIYPSINYAGGTTNNTAIINQTWIYVNVSVIETNFKNITFLLWNTTSQVNSTTFITAIYSINWTNLAYTNYTYNVSIYDKAENFNVSSTRNANLSLTGS